MKLSIGMVATDEIKFLVKSVPMLMAAIPEGMEHEVLFIDNASLDGASGYVSGKFPTIKLIKNKVREGFALNLNRMISLSKGQYLLIVDANAFISRDYLTALFEGMENSASCGVISGKLLKADENGSAIIGPNGKRIIDSTGHSIMRNYRVVNRGELEEDIGQYDQQEGLFGLCTAATLFRKKALEDIKYHDEYFDGSFVSHKEDIDICWRLRLKGWECLYEPKAEAYHYRTWPRGKGRSSISHKVRIDSFKNRYLLIVKNELFRNFLRNSPFFIVFELKVLIYAIFREPFLFAAYFKAIELLPAALKKRKVIMKGKKVSSAQMFRWFK